MTQQAYEQTVKHQEHIEDLLTRESYVAWIESLSTDEFFAMNRNNNGLTGSYLKEHGLPLDSIIKGL